MGKAIALPAFVYFDIDEQKYITQIGPPLENYSFKDSLADATNMNQTFEALISENPERYMWFMKWYVTRPDGEKEVY